MGAGKWLVVVIGTGLAAGVVAAGMTTGAMRQWPDSAAGVDSHESRNSPGDPNFVPEADAALAGRQAIGRDFGPGEDDGRGDYGDDDGQDGAWQDDGGYPSRGYADNGGFRHGRHGYVEGSRVYPGTGWQQDPDQAGVYPDEAYPQARGAVISRAPSSGWADGRDDEEPATAPNPPVPSARTVTGALQSSAVSNRVPAPTDPDGAAEAAARARAAARDVLQAERNTP